MQCQNEMKLCGSSQQEYAYCIPSDQECALVDLSFESVLNEESGEQELSVI